VRVSLPLLLAAVAMPSMFAVPISWTAWQSENAGAGTASGILTLPGGSTTTVSFSTSIPSTLVGICTGICSDGNHWTPAATYENTVGPVAVDNAPSGSLVQITGANPAETRTTYTLTFGTTVVNPVMAISSLGAGAIGIVPAATAVYDFYQPFTLLNTGPGFFGGNATTMTAPTMYELSGTEGNGIIAFTGSFNSITWTAPTFENYQEITVGDPNPSPEPAGWSLALGGFVMIGAARFRRR